MTAVQELIVKIKKRIPFFQYSVYQDDFDEAVEKEKEQIIDSFVECWKANMPDGYECKLSAKEYYNQNYIQKEEQKQNIIDLMEADEKDGLYDQSFQKSDKEIENWHIIESLKEKYEKK